MKARQCSPTVQSVRKKKFAGKKTKWEKRRIVRRITRTVKGKKPLVEPLTIAPANERQAALREGNMVFYDGKQRVVLPLDFKSGNAPDGRLQGVYKLENSLFVFRRSLDIAHKNWMILLKIKNAGNRIEEAQVGYFFLDKALGHMDLSKEIKGHGLGLKGTSKTERHIRNLSEGSHKFKAGKNFVKLFEKLGYKKGNRPQDRLMEKSGKLQRKDNIDQFHRIEAIDPKTGKARIFTFSIKKSSSK